jgi:hypothetical protein
MSRALCWCIVLSIAACSSVAAKTAAEKSSSSDAGPRLAAAQPDSDPFRSIVDLGTDRAVFPIALADAGGVLAPFGAFKRESPSADELVLRGGAAPWRRIEASYERDAQGAWMFIHLTFFVTDPAGGPPPFDQLDRLITAKLGSPSGTKKRKGKSTLAVWNLVKETKVVLARDKGRLPGEQKPIDHVKLVIGEVIDDMDE